MSEQIYRAMADQIRAAQAEAPDDETAASLDRAYAAYMTAARHLKNAATRESVAVGARMAATTHFRRGNRVMSDHLDTMAEEHKAAAALLREMAAVDAARADAHYANANQAEAAEPEARRSVGRRSTAAKPAENEPEAPEPEPIEHAAMTEDEG